VADLAALKGATIAFDLDGTLVESAPDLVGTLNVILGEEGLSPLPLAEARDFIGRGAAWLLKRGFSAAGAEIHPEHAEPLLQRFLAHYNAHIADESYAYPGCIEALTVLKDAGARLVVCTNKLTGLSENLLGQLGMTAYFDAIVGADAVSAIKPDKAHLIEAVAAAGGDIGRTVMVGDAATDAGAARGAGAGLILVSFGYTEIPAAELAPDVLIHHYDELVESCLRLLPGLPA
jgi:phosphoglycolate phosphatase